MNKQIVDNMIKSPTVTFDYFGGKKIMKIHSYINNKNKMVINQDEACLLLIELNKFINS
jgi:hypothetical protein